MLSPDESITQPLGTWQMSLQLVVDDESTAAHFSQEERPTLPAADE